MIEIKNLQKIDGQNTVLEIESEVAAGQIAAVVGPTDSGKAVLLDLLTGQSQPTTGEISICSLHPGRDKTALAVKLGVLFAENGLYERLSVLDNLSFHCRLRGLPPSHAQEALAWVGLAGQAAVKVDKLPYSLARRLAFARAVLHRPQALLLFSPFSECDSTTSALLARLVREQADAGTAVLMIDEESTGLTRLAAVVYVLEHGRVARFFTPESDAHTEMPFKVPSRQEGQVALVNPVDILYISAEDGQTCLHTVQGQVPSHLSLAELEERLARNGFFRAHRSFLVNLQRVRAIVPYTRDSFTLILDDGAGTEIPLSKTAARELKDTLGY